MRVARGELTADEAAAEQIGETTDAVWGELVGGKEAAAITGVDWNRHRHLSQRRDFPLPAAHIGNWRLWRRSDIEAYARGERDNYETKTEDELQGDVIGVRQLAMRLGTGYDLLRNQIQRRSWHLVPKPTGKIGGHFSYWSLADDEEWERERGEPHSA